VNDVIVGVDGAKISSYDDLFTALESYKVGDRVTLTVEKNSQQRKVPFTLVRD